MPRLALVALALAVAGPAYGYELLRVNNNPCARSDHDLFWRGHTVPVSVAPLPVAFRGLATEAWQTWNAHFGGFAFAAGGSVAPCVRDGVASVSIAATACDDVPFEGALAVTRSVWHADSGQLIDADITFQPDTPVVGNNEDLFRQVAMHELGHVLGLAHSDACGASGAGTLMKAFLNFNDPVLFAPQDDDVAGANAIYGSAGGGGSSSGGMNSCAIAPVRHDRAALIWLLPVALALIARLLSPQLTRRPFSSK